ncbi:MAG: hypothetical protein HYV45_02415 [Candidatus Moranbacteria bacterium]|nr:hypothetical protein [Candidatus Moranbacteria bacterium]
MGAIVLSGCTLSGTSLTGNVSGSIWKSFDGGKTFVPKITVDEKRKISSADVLSLAIDPFNAQVIYIGTMENGLFKTSDGGEHWEPLEFPPLKNYGLTIDRQYTDRIYASGVYKDIAKIYRSDDGGKNWKEVYTEPGKGTVITVLRTHPQVQGVLYAGTSAGVTIKSTNGGDTWDNMGAASGPVMKILFEKNVPEKVQLLVFEKGIRTSYDGGKTWTDDFGVMMTTPQSLAATVRPDGILTAFSDPFGTGTIYVGAKNGLFRSRDGGKTWEAIDIIESSKKYPIRAIAVNPNDSNEIVYAAGSAFYKSVDGGIKWATTELTIDRGVSVIEYDPNETSVLYFGLRAF